MIITPEPLYVSDPAPHDRAGLKTAESGAFCPLIPPKFFSDCLRDGRLRLTDWGLEKRCSRCRDYWPADSEFFSANATRPDGLMHYCKACYLELTGRSAVGRAA